MNQNMAPKSLPCVLLVAVLSLAVTKTVFARTDQVSVKQKPTKKIQTLQSVIEKAIQQQRQSSIKKLAFIEQLQKELETQPHTQENRSRILLAQAITLMSEDETILPAIELLRKASELSPLKLKNETSSKIWTDLQKKLNSDENTNFNALADAAWSLSFTDAASDGEQLFFSAMAAQRRGDSGKALEILDKIQPTSYRYREAKLHEGLLNASLGQSQKARSALEIVLSLDLTEAEKNKNIDHKDLIQIKEVASLNLARLMFEAKEYNEAISLYRSIDSESPLFYESISEQGWAFFLAGLPNRALGVKYGATSPFFNQQFQPDQYFLSASVHYWLCDFNSSRDTIRAFVTHTKDDANLLKKWKIEDTDSKDKRDKFIDEAFNISENIFLGVSDKNNRIGPRLFQTLARKKPLQKRMNELEQLRQKRFEVQKQQLPLRAKKVILDGFLSREESERRSIGLYAFSIIDTLRRDYERSLGQMRMIHLEIMTAEKDRLMKTSRSAQGQEFLGSEEEFIEAVEKSPQLWVDEKREFWKDELDSFVFQKTSQCKDYERGEIK